MSEINVTPLVGVMIVLLIIVMLTASKRTVGVDLGANAVLSQVALPADAGASQPTPISITIDGDGRIFLENAEIGVDAIVPKLVALREAGGQTQVLVRGDNAASYGDVAKVLVRIKETGLPVTLLTDRAAQD